MNSKHFTEKPYSSIPLDRVETVPIQFDDIIEQVDKMIMSLGVKPYESCKRGCVASKNVKPRSAQKIVQTIHSRFFDVIRSTLRESDIPEEQRAEQLAHVREIEEALTSVLKVSTNMQKELDINSVLFTMYGSLNELIRNSLKK